MKIFNIGLFGQILPASSEINRELVNFLFDAQKLRRANAQTRHSPDFQSFFSAWIVIKIDFY